MNLPLLATLLLCGFEAESDRDHWKAHDARIQRIRAHATQGEWALQITLDRTSYPGLSLRRSLLARWPDYEVARLDVFNPQPMPVTLTIRLDDAHSTSYATRYNENFTLRPGPNTIELPVRQLRATDRARNLDAARLTRLLLFAVNPPLPLTLYLDNFRLENAASTSAWPELKTDDPFWGIDHDWWPGKNVWLEEVLPRLPECDRTEARRREFYDKHFYLEPYTLPANPAIIRLNAARGQTVTAFFTANAARAPAFSKCTVELRVVRLQERPVAPGIFRIHETALLPVERVAHPQRFALTIHVGTDASADTQRAEVAGIPVELRVWPFELPAPQELPITFGWWYSPSPDPAIRDLELRDMVEHGFNSTTMSVPRPAVNSSNGVVTLMTAPEDEFLAALRRAGLAGKHPQLMGVLRTAQVLADELDAPEFSARFTPKFMEALTRLNEWTRANDYTTLAYVIDEPREEALNPWNRNCADTKRFLDLYRQAKIPAAISLMRDSESGTSYLPLLDFVDVVLTHAWPASRGILERARHGQPQLWIYNAGMDRLSFGFYPWAIGARGRFEWHYAWWTRAWDPFAGTSESAWANGVGATLPSPAGPVPTAAYEKVRAGIDDYRFLVLAEKRPEARKFLEELREKVPRYLEGDLPGDATLDAWRERLAELIADGQGAAAE